MLEEGAQVTPRRMRWLRKIRGRVVPDPLGGLGMFFNASTKSRNCFVVDYRCAVRSILSVAGTSEQSVDTLRTDFNEVVEEFRRPDFELGLVLQQWWRCVFGIAETTSSGRYRLVMSGRNNRRTNVAAGFDWLRAGWHW